MTGPSPREATEARRRRMLRQIADRDVLVAVAPNLAELARVYGAAVEPVGRHSLENVAALRRRGLMPTLWVRHGFRRHRKAFKRFLALVDGVDPKHPGWIGIEVDHIVSEKQVKVIGPAPWHRVEALPRTVNGDWGRTIERVAAASGFAKRLNPWRDMSDLAIAKHLLLRCPTGPDDMAAIEAIVAEMRRFGLDYGGAKMMRDMLVHALRHLESNVRKSDRPAEGAETGESAPA